MPLTIRLILIGLLSFGPAHALDRLTPGGAELGRVLGGKLERSIDLAGDQPVATFGLARRSGQPMLQQTITGAWEYWDGDLATLIDARLPLGVGTVTYRVEETPIGADAVILGYRTPDGLKFGILGLGGQK